MATNVWKGGAAAVAQVDKLLPGGTIEADDLFIVTINGKSLSTAAGGTAVTDVTAAVTAAFNASDEPEFAEITAADATTHITLTADTPGVPFTATCSTTEAGGGAADAQTFARSAITANSGPNDALIDSNWSTGDVPGADDVVFENSSVDCLYNLDQLGTVAGTVILTSVTVKRSYTGKIGLPRQNPAGYVEYRPTALALGTAVTSINVGEGVGAGSSRINLSIGDLTAALAINVYYTGARLVVGIPPLLITTGTQSDDTTLTVNKGDVGVAIYGGETAVIDILDVGYVTSETSDATVTCGTGVSPLTTITKSGGAVTIQSNAVTLVNNGGTTTIARAATLTTGTINKGTLYYNSSGTATTLNVGGEGILDFRQDSRSRTVTNTTIHKGGAIYDPAKTVTWTNGIDVYYCGLPDVTLELGDHQTYVMSAI